MFILWLKNALLMFTHLWRNKALKCEVLYIHGLSYKILLWLRSMVDQRHLTIFDDKGCVIKHIQVIHEVVAKVIKDLEDDLYKLVLNPNLIINI